MKVRRNSMGAGIRRLVYGIIGGVLGLALAAVLLLGPLNARPQVPFDQATGFLALCFTAFMGWAGLEAGGLVAQDAESAIEIRNEPPQSSPASHDA